MTKTQICNRALAILGHDRTVTDFDGKTAGVYNDQSTEAVRCREFFDAALQECLAEHDWDFAAVEKNLGLVHSDALGWSRFQLPEDAIKVVLVTDGMGRPLRTRRNRDFFEVETLGGGATVRYITTDIDTAELPHKFAEALVYKLAAFICGPMFGDDKKAEGYMTLASRKLSEAVTKETDETAYRGEPVNPFMSARR